MRTRPLILISILFLLPASSAFSSTGERPEASGGILDLRDWDFSTGGIIKLFGEWEFCWNDYIAPGEPMPPENTSLITLPSYWKNHNHLGSVLPKHGRATFRLKILLPETDTPLALNYKYVFTAYNLYIDNSLAEYSGVPGTDAETSKPYFKQDTVVFTPERNVITLTFHVSNYEMNKGGLWETIYLGSVESIYGAESRRMAIEIIAISTILIMGLYHLGIFIYRHEDTTALYFSIFCILIALRALATGEILFERMFPGISWSLLLKLEYGSFYAAVPVFIMYLRSIYEDYVPLPLVRVFQSAGAIFLLQVTILPPHFFNLTLSAGQLFTAAAGVFAVLILTRAVVSKRENSLILLAGFMIMFLTFVNDLLHANEIIHTGLFMPFGFFVFIFSQAILILNRSTLWFKTIEKQSRELKVSNEMFERSRQGTILGLAKLAEYRDEDTGKHLERIREYCRLLSIRLSQKEKYRDYITERYINDLYQSAILHDIGKVAVPDAILLKKGKLDEEEFSQIKLHTKFGGDALLNIESQTNMKSFLTLGKEIAWFHHEKWDGSGYPDGLHKEAIPLSARITAVADVYDALTSERPYKKAFSHETAKSIIIEGRGTHFDPDIVDVFIELEGDFNSVRQAHADH